MQRRDTVITGGAGFIGTNLALSHLREGRPVHILDNLSRAGVENNVLELKKSYPRLLRFTQADVQDGREIEQAVSNAEVIYHLAAQVAVTTSLQDPLSDLETNLLGTVRVLEAVRRSGSYCPVLFTSTNKVYGKLEGVKLQKQGLRWLPEDAKMAENGVGESQSLRFLSPYGCSKGSADQYVLDYAQSYNLPATVFRMSCIYGPFQLGSEDQGWVAHFLRQGMKREPITIFGDGRQVRDLLFVDDLVSAMRLAVDNINSTSGQAFNLGGGSLNSLSLIELVGELSSLLGYQVDVEWDDERLADQRWYVADTTKLRNRLGWAPGTSVKQGLVALRDWYLNRPSLIEPMHREADARTEAQVA